MANEISSKKLNKVLIAVDDTKGSQTILSMFNNMVHPPGEVILLHVTKPLGNSLMADMIGEPSLTTLQEAMEGTEYMEQLNEKGQRILNYYTRELENGGLISVKPMLRMGLPEEEILKVADEEGVDLMILGNNGRTFVSRLLTGSLSERLEERAPVPVVVARKNGNQILTTVKDKSLAWSESYDVK